MNQKPKNIAELRAMMAAGKIVRVYIDWTKDSAKRTVLHFADGQIMTDLPGRLGYLIIDQTRRAAKVAK